MIRLIGCSGFKTANKLFNLGLTANFLRNFPADGLLRWLSAFQLAANLHKTLGVLFAYQQQLLLLIQNNGRSYGNGVHIYFTKA